MRAPAIGTLLATLMIFVSCGLGSAQTMPRAGETWLLKIDAFGCAKNEDLDRLLRLLHQDDQTEFRALLLNLRGERLCQDLPKGLQVLVDRMSPMECSTIALVSDKADILIVGTRWRRFCSQ